MMSWQPRCRLSDDSTRYTFDGVLQEKDVMLRYVVEEVDRLKAMYEERLARTTAERGVAAAAKKQALERLSAAEARADKAACDAQAATCSLAELTKQDSSHAQQLKVGVPPPRSRALGVQSRRCHIKRMVQDGSHGCCLRCTCAALSCSRFGGERLPPCRWLRPGRRPQRREQHRGWQRLLGHSGG